MDLLLFGQIKKKKHEININFKNPFWRLGPDLRVAQSLVSANHVTFVDLAQVARSMVSTN